MPNRKKMIKVETKEAEVEVDGIVYVETITSRVYEDGSKSVACSTRSPKHTEKVERPKSQLDRIEEALAEILKKLH